MAKSESLYLPVGTNNTSVTFVNADSTTPKTVFTAGANDSDLLGLIAATNDTAAVVVRVAIKRSSVEYILSTISVPISAGYGSTGLVPAIDLLNSSMMPGLTVNSAGKRYIPCKSGDTIEVSPLNAVTAGRTLYISAFGQDY